MLAALGARNLIATAESFVNHAEAGHFVADGCGETLSNLLALAGGVTGPRAKCKSAAVRIRARRQAKSPGGKKTPFGDGPDRIPRREPGRGVRARRPPAPGRMRSSRSSDRTTFVDRRGNYAVGSWLSTNTVFVGQTADTPAFAVEHRKWWRTEGHKHYPEAKPCRSPGE